MIVTNRLELIPATVEMTRAALEGAQALGDGLRCKVPPTWPPDYLDASALEYTLERLGERPDQAGWWLYFVVLKGEGADRTLIGAAGYAGPPSEEGSVEVGYGIVSDYRRRGFASEAVGGLLAHAFARPEILRVIAHTKNEPAASIGVFQKCGFRLAGDGPEPGVIRFVITRGKYFGGEGDPGACGSITTG